MLLGGGLMVNGVVLSIDAICPFSRPPAMTRGFAPPEHWQVLVNQHFRGALKPPFNDSARYAAGLSRDYYGALAVLT